MNMRDGLKYESEKANGFGALFSLTRINRNKRAQQAAPLRIWKSCHLAHEFDGRGFKGVHYYFILVIFASLALFPLIFVFIQSFFSSAELNQNYGDLLGINGANTFAMPLIPKRATLNNYAGILVNNPFTLVKFWVSVLLSLSIVAGQVAISCLGGYGLAKFNFRSKSIMFFLVVVAMMLPHQVTLVPNYIVLDSLGWIGSYAALIVPGIFSTFGVFLISQVFASIPNEVIEAAQIDGANQMSILFKVVIPYRKSGVISLVILSFIDNWNMVEQPLVFLKDPLRFPLSIFLSRVNAADPGLGFASGILAALPPLLLFLFYMDELASGIEYSNLK